LLKSLPAQADALNQIEAGYREVHAACWRIAAEPCIRFTHTITIEELPPK